MLLREEMFERAAELFYEAAAAPELWPGALQSIADACGAQGASILPVHPGPDVAYPSPGIEEYVHDLVHDGWASTNNSRMQRGLALTAAGKKGLITDSDMFTPEELRRDVFFNEFIQPHRMGATAGMVLTHYGRELVLPIALERSARSGAFLPGEVRRMNLLMALLKPAAELTLKVGLAAARSLADGLSAPGRDTALLAPSGRIIHQAPGFARHLGADLAVRAGHLRSSHPAADRRLLAAIGKCVQPGPVVSRIAGPVALPRRGRRPLIAQVAPIAGVGQDMLMLARAALILTDPDAGVPLDRIAVSLAAQGLTEAETRLARRIGLGESLAAVAEEERITIETARSRLKAVFHKTGTHRQAELAAFVMRLAR